MNELKALWLPHRCAHLLLAGLLQVTDGQTVLGVTNGVEMLTKITAAGCSVTALIAGCVAVVPTEPLLATAAALAVFG